MTGICLLPTLSSPVQCEQLIVSNNLLFILLKKKKIRGQTASALLTFAALVSDNHLLFWSNQRGCGFHSWGGTSLPLGLTCPLSLGLILLVPAQRGPALLSWDPEGTEGCLQSLGDMQ